MNLKTTVLLVDDRPPRLKDGLHKHNQTISDLLSIEGFHIADSKECESIFKELKNSNKEVFNSYNLVIIHESRLEGNSKQMLSSFKGKDFILFSGKLNTRINKQLDYEEKDIKKNNYILEVNSKDLYSARLKGFLENYTSNNIENITELIYGHNWKLNTLLTYRQVLIDAKYGDDINSGEKRKVLMNCEEIVGKKSLYQLTNEIEMFINLL